MKKDNVVGDNTQQRGKYKATCNEWLYIFLLADEALAKAGT
jgi:hypothetical protein